MCRVLEVSASGYYAWVKREPSKRAREDEVLRKKIEAIHSESRGTYGRPRVHAELKEEGEHVGCKRITRLMRQAGLQGVSRRKKYRTTVRDRDARPAPDLVDRNFTVERPDQLWVADITYLKVLERWRYLAVVMDRHTRRIVGWSLGHNKTTHLTLRALSRALANRHPRPGLIFHSDRGVEYAAYEFRTRLAALGIRQSMNRPGEPTDNAHMESFFHSLKTERLYGCTFETDADLRRALRAYISFYNQRRLHSSLDYRSPADYERVAA
jgi:transposase InsO family protein